ncbi:Pentatricopeptide repeat-containing protein [Drosera capensis]
MKSTSSVDATADEACSVEMRIDERMKPMTGRDHRRLRSSPKMLCWSSGSVLRSCSRAFLLPRLCREVSSLYGEPPKSDEISSAEISRDIHAQTRDVDDVCRIIQGGVWGPSVEAALSNSNNKPQQDLVIAVLKRLKDVKTAINYFQWAERTTDQAHCPEAYNSLLMVMAGSKRFDGLEEVLEEMSVAGIGPFNKSCIDIVNSCVKSRMLKEAVHFIESMRKFKFRPAFPACTVLIGALASADEPDLMLNLLHQMQELGYEVHVLLFATVARVFARAGRVDDALSLLGEMKSNSLYADIVLHNVCIDTSGKLGKVDMAWKFFHEMKSHGLVPDKVTCTSMIGILCRAKKLNEAVELFEQMEANRAVPCAYAYNTMIMGYG